MPKEKAPARKGQRLELSGNAVILYKKKEEGQTISLYIYSLNSLGKKKLVFIGDQSTYLLQKVE